MEITTILTWTLGTILTLGTIGIGVGYVYSQFYKGKKSQTDEVIESGETTLGYALSQIKVAEGRAASQDNEISNLRKEIKEMGDLHTRQVVELRALIEEKDKELQKYIAIMQGKDPALQTAASAMITYISKSEEFMRMTTTTLGHIMSVSDRLLGVPGTAPVINKA